jgi:hypothetical protein
MKFEIEENPTEIKECIQQVREQIFCDKKGVYKIPQDLKIVGYPEEVINSFLDFIAQFDEHQSGILKNIKEGIFTVECREEDEIKNERTRA